MKKIYFYYSAKYDEIVWATKPEKKEIGTTFYAKLTLEHDKRRKIKTFITYIGAL